MFRDNCGKVSSMRISFFISMILSCILVFSALIGLYYDKEINILITSAITFMSISTAGKQVQNFTESKQVKK